MSEDADIEGLAAEYVLGSLPPGERSAVKQRLDRDRALADAVAGWERRLAPLSLLAPGIAPPQQSLERLLGEIARRSIAGQQGGRAVALRRADRWRWAATGLAAAVMALAITLGFNIGRKPATVGPLLAVLSKGGTSTADEPAGPAAPMFLATVDPGAAALTVRQIAGRRPASERSYAVWLTARDAASPIFVGLLSKSEAATSFPVSAGAARNWAGGTLTISLEVGSPGQAPAGPIVSSGMLGTAAR